MIKNNYGDLEGLVTEAFHLEYTYKDVNYYFGTVAVKRNSGIFDNIPVCIPNFVISDNEILNIKVSDTLKLQGTFRSKNKMIEGKMKLLLRFYAIPYDPLFHIEITQSDPNYMDDIILIGTLCKPVVFRKTPKGLKICDILIACNRNHNSDYIPLICWGSISDKCKNLFIGDKIQILGRIQSREYVRQNETKKRTALEVSVMKLYSVEVSKHNAI